MHEPRHDLAEFNTPADSINRVVLHARVIDKLTEQHIDEFKLCMDRDEYFRDRLKTVNGAYRKHIEGK